MALELTAAIVSVAVAYYMGRRVGFIRGVEAGSRVGWRQCVAEVRKRATGVRDGRGAA